MKNIVLLIVVVAGFSFGLYFYSRGFLLTRNTLGKNNTCTDGGPPIANDNQSICVIKPRFRRAIWIVIDALRFDFVAPIRNGTTTNEFYHNKLTTIHELLSRRPRNSLLYKFIADAPTTTLQRLKGLTTGSLPTFIDAGSNFGGTELDEDNLIDQLARRNRRLTFLGDDTWMTLFPTQFDRSFPFPSFDVKDLHTVDNGILEHLFDELNGGKSDWDVLIAHFLGVDHCGHKYGPNHPEMASKLEQMNQVLRRVIDSMDSETILFVLGDHGMTQAGDHGGDSNDEVSSALFVYSQSELHREEVNIRNSVNQIDLVPTMALLLDIPIPFSNLGKVMIELFPDQSVRSRAVELNIMQVFRFSDMYMTNFHDQLLAGHLQPLFKTYYAQEPGELTIEKYLEYVSRISSIFVECWAKFHIGWMALGVVTLFETFLWLLSYLIDRVQSIRGRRLLLKATSFVLSFWVVMTRQETVPPLVGIFFGLPIIFHLHTIVSSMWHSETKNGSTSEDDGRRSGCLVSIFAGLLLIIHGLSQFSNSFVVYENSMSHYFTAALFGLLLVLNSSKQQSTTKTDSFRKQYVDKKTKKHGSSSIISKLVQAVDSKFGGWTSICWCALSMVLLRASTQFWRCREEQAPCVSSVFTLAFASLLDDNTRMTRIVLAIVCLIGSCYFSRRFLVYNGHLTGGETLFGVIVDFGHTLMALLTVVYWILQWIPERHVAATISTNAHLVPPLICYAIFASIILFFAIEPVLTTIRVLRTNNNSRRAIPPSPASFAGEALNETEQVRRAYEHLKQNWRYYLKNDHEEQHADEENQQRLAAFGLASGYSGPLVALWFSMAMVFGLILGDGFAFPAFAFNLIGVALMELSSAGDVSHLTFVATLVELSTHFFYSFGHQPTFATIPWDAAFVGIPGNFRFRAVQATMVILRISAAHILVVFLIPLRACWPYYRGKLGVFSVQRQSEGSASAMTMESGGDAEIIRTEADLIRRKDEFLSNVLYLDCAFLAAAAVKMLCSTLASAVHRRHLMVWKVFAPKFIFDGIHFLVICAAIIVQYSLVSRLHTALLRKFSNAEFISQQKAK